MKKLILSLAAVAAMGIAGTAFGAPIFVTDPTPNGSFTGNYVVSQDDPSTAQDEYQEAQQQGYVGVYDGSNGQTGVVACNGNKQTLGNNPQSGEPLVGYIWVGTGLRPDKDSPSAEAPPGNGVIGAGSNHGGSYSRGQGTPTGDSPCPDQNPQGINE